METKSYTKGDILVAILIIIGVFCITMSFYEESETKRTFDYEVTKGMVTYFKLEEVILFPHLYVVDKVGILEYKYKVNGVEYTSNKVSYDPEAFLKYNKKYKQGMEVNIYYDKENPAEAVLIPGKRLFYMTLYFIVGIALLIAGFGLFYSNVKAEIETMKYRSAVDNGNAIH